MGVAISILGSGSSGNAALVSSSRTRVLFDVGFSKKEMVRRLDQVHVRADSIDAVFISHEHSDHICGLPRFCKNMKTPVFMTDGTRHSSRLKKNFGPIHTITGGQQI